MRIGITYNLKNEFPPAAEMDDEYSEEFDNEQTIDAISSVLESNGYETVKLGGDLRILDRLKEERVDFVFNIAEGYYGRNREAHIPAILEMLNIPYSGSDPLTLGLTLDKSVAKKIIDHARIPTPAYYIIKRLEDVYEADNHLTYPMIIKPAWEGSSKGIYNASRVFDKAELKNMAEVLFRKYPHQSLLAEEYVKGKEVTVGVIGNNPPKILGLMEISGKDKSSEDFFYSLETKRDWKELVEYSAHPRLPQRVVEQIKRYAVVAFAQFGCRDIARADFKVSEYNKPFLLEINPLPGLSPEYGDLVIMAEKYGMNYEDLILGILDHAFSRYGILKGRTTEHRLAYEEI